MPSSPWTAAGWRGRHSHDDCNCHHPSATRDHALRAIIRASFLAQLALGLLFWTGRATQLIPLHRLNGFVLVIAVWALAFIAARAGVNLRLVAAAVLWGLVAPVLGLTQERILPGSFHWTIQILHLLVGFALIGLAENLGRRLSGELPVQVKGR